MSMTTKQKLSKTRATISNHVYPKRGGYNGLNQQRSLDLVDRYEALKEQALNENVWLEWCEENGKSPEHDAYDCWA